MSRVRRFFQRRIRIMALLSLCAIGLGQLPIWVFELFSHFLPYYAVVFICAVLVDAGKWRYLWLLATLFATTWLLQGQLTHPKITPSQRLLWYNVHLHNSQMPTEQAHILAQSADFLAFAELAPSADWQALRTAYPYQNCEFISDSPFALALWSKQALSACEIKLAAEYPYIEAKSAQLSIFVLHPPPPITPELALSRELYLHQVSGEIAQAEQALVVGDMNSSPFSPIFRQFMNEANVAMQTPYYLPTWKPFWLNIDHVFVRGITPKVSALAWVASDHRALVVDW